MKQTAEDDASIPPLRDRPWVVTLVCLWWFIAAPIVCLLTGVEISRVLSAPGASAALRASYVALGVYTVVVGLGGVSMIGVWRMRKWSVIALGILFIVSQLVALLAGAWSLGGFLSWLIAVVVGVTHYSKMK